MTPDGKWHERGEMGWFGVTHYKNQPEFPQKKDFKIEAEYDKALEVSRAEFKKFEDRQIEAWRKESQKILEANKDCLAVGVDYHI